MMHRKPLCCEFLRQHHRYQLRTALCLRRGFRSSMLWKPASYTLEAAILMPFVLFVLVLTGMAGVYLHDRSAALSDAQAITIHGRMLLLEDADNAQAALEEWIPGSGTAGMLAADVVSEGGIDAVQITSSVCGEIESVFSDLFAAWGWPVFGSFSQTDEDWFVSPCTLIRTARILESAE